MKVLGFLFLVVLVTLLCGFLVAMCWDVALVPQGLKPMSTLEGAALFGLGTLLGGGAQYKVNSAQRR